MALFDAHPGTKSSLGRSASSPVPPPTRTQRRHRPDAVPQPTPFSAYSGISPTPVETPTLRQPTPSPSPYARHRTSKSPALGAIALLMIIGANLTAALGLLPLVPTLRHLMVMARDGQRLTAAQFQALPIDPSLSWMINGATWVGMIALVLGIAAVVTNRGRGMGVLTIILAIVGPFLVGVFWGLLAATP